MPTNYTVEQYDCIDSIALAHGFFPETVWNHPNNATLKEKRKDQNVLLPGDVVVIPDKRTKELKAKSNTIHTYRRKGVPKLFSVQIKLPSGAPLKDHPYELGIDAHAPKKGKTDSAGWVKTYIPPNAREAKLLIAGSTYTLELGQLDPVTETTGVQGRLRALGYFTGDIDGTLSSETVDAIKTFQAFHECEATGEIDDALRKLLVAETGT